MAQNMSRARSTSVRESNYELFAENNNTVKIILFESESVISP